MLLAKLNKLKQSLYKLEDKHLTFHIGDDKNWMNPKYNDYQLYNLQELINIVNSLLQTGEFQQSIPKRVLLKEIMFHAEEVSSYIKSTKTLAHFEYNPKVLLRHYSNQDFEKVIARTVPKRKTIIDRIFNRISKI